MSFMVIKLLTIAIRWHKVILFNRVEKIVLKLVVLGSDYFAIAVSVDSDSKIVGYSNSSY